MRSDLFSSRKSIHVKLKKEVHAALREKLFRCGLTMQDLFNDAAELVLSESPKAERLLQRITKKKLSAEVQKLSKANKLQLGDLDNETLYNLLEENDDQGHEQE